MANPAEDKSIYYVPNNGWYPVFVALGAASMLAGLGHWLNTTKAGQPASLGLFYFGVATLAVVLFKWFTKVIAENHAGLPNALLKRSYVWGMSWFIFSEVMFFFAFFGALFYAREFAVSWLGGEGDKGITGKYLWPDFKPTWPVIHNPDPTRFPNPSESMASPGVSHWLSYLPFYNTVILLTSSVTVHFAHTGVKNNNRFALKFWLTLTVLLGCTFLFVQGYEYHHAYTEMNLMLTTGAYGATFFMLTGFHGFHVTLGTIMLIVIFLRSLRGHFTPQHHFAFEGVSWYWHFVDVVWLLLFVLVYWL